MDTNRARHIESKRSRGRNLPYSGNGEAEGTSRIVLRMLRVHSSASKTFRVSAIRKPIDAVASWFAATTK